MSDVFVLFFNFFAFTEVPPVRVLLRASVVVVMAPFVVASVVEPALFCSSVVPVPTASRVLAVPLIPELDAFERFALVVEPLLLVRTDPLSVVPEVTVPALFCSSVVPVVLDPVVPVEFVD